MRLLLRGEREVDAREQSIRMAIAQICHEEQLIIWESEVIEEIMDHIKDPLDGEDVVNLRADVRRAILHVAKGVLSSLERPI